ncbi:hypothetical protein N7U66_01970 [Lacinutrix neustonica]|uniref:Uncharacterized protein n=1 Tax=Lacinutrix neustonica TaxID=2980107 RepID=A0A9E8MVT6_9FLAO|nr:hypothetical protein [Lacinutrix neustonica]WAC02503.1 hypothetical protein N7U66_01970 [Lacinutrix neustonica]
MIKILNLIKKHFFVIIVIIIAISLGLFKFLKKKPTDQNGVASGYLNDMNVPQNEHKDYNHVALNVAHHLGTAYSKFDPRHWTENDQEVYSLIKLLDQKGFDVVSSLYFNVYAKGNTLSSDLARLLDAEYYEKLTVK